MGGNSKLVDRIEAAGLLRRESAAEDRRASRLVLTPDGQLKLAAASQTCEMELATVLNAVLHPDEELLLHDLVRRLLVAADADGSC